MPSFPLYPDPYAEGLPRPRSYDRTMPTSASAPRDDEPRRRRRKDDGEQRERDRDRDQDSNSSKDKLRKEKVKVYRKRESSRERDKERKRESDSPRSTISERGVGRSRRVEVIVPEMDRRSASGSMSDVRFKTSYPTFSKAHSREAVHSVEDVRATKPATPAATDVSPDRRRNSTPAKPPTNPPPSPPLTAENPGLRRSGSGSSIRDAANAAKASMSAERRSMDSARPRASVTVKPAKSGVSLRGSAEQNQSDVSSMPGAFPEDERRITPSSGYRRTESTASNPQSTLTQNTDTTGDSESTVDSGATQVPTEHPHYGKTVRQPHVVHVEESRTFEAEPITPMPRREPMTHPKKAPADINVGSANAYLSTPQAFGMTPTTAVPPPPPPPPPPPVATGKDPPRVDYLLKNGGLPVPVPKRLVQTAPQVQSYSVYQSPALLQQAPLEEYSKIFSSIHQRLDDYLHVLRSSGSLAVATGYKSVARRLLDKLSQVFARDISSVRCDCVICKTTPQPALSDEEDSGISWGEILEFVSGRRELPPWPPFSIKPDEDGLGISGFTQAPMQKLDIDVPEEYKDHYIRQNQKTKRAVQSWLAQQPEFPSSPPDNADEDTLMFAMMTKLNTEQRNYFIALMHGQSFISQSRAPTPAERPSTSSAALNRARNALQRLYRLDKPPRDCESAMYLLNNPHLHGMVATLAEVNEAEWEILVSGRFDGFLWSGAEAPFPPSASAYASPVNSRAPSRGANATPFSRTTTPFSGMSGAVPSRGPAPFRSGSDGTTPPGNLFPTRGPTPGAPGVSAPGPVQLDEDTEIAVLAEVERNLFTDMERFEDAFEILHSRAELVRQMLRERSAGLAMQAQLRRGSADTGAFVRLDTPASGITDFEDEDDDGLGDLASLAPDDSASQISVNRRHRRRQGRENRTPAPVKEEAEEESLFEEEIQRDERRNGGRRSKY